MREHGLEVLCTSISVVRSLLTVVVLVVDEAAATLLESRRVSQAAMFEVQRVVYPWIARSRLL